MYKAVLIQAFSGDPALIKLFRVILQGLSQLIVSFVSERLGGRIFLS